MKLNPLGSLFTRSWYRGEKGRKIPDDYYISHAKQFHRYGWLVIAYIVQERASAHEIQLGLLG